MTQQTTPNQTDQKSQEVNETLFDNPFHIEDLLIFDDATLSRMLASNGFGLTVEHLASGLCGAPPELIRRIQRNLSPRQRASFRRLSRRYLSQEEISRARKDLLDALFWELTYWKTPELYEELTEGERLHPGIFQRLESDLDSKVVLDVGAGSGRASFECLRHGARIVYAVEPSPGLLKILESKINGQPLNHRIQSLRGSFSEIPLEDRSVDIAISCSAFTAEPEQGGEVGLTEMARVTKLGGKIVLIWPRPQDREWLTEHGFHYVALPASQEMRVQFQSLPAAVRCVRRFYARNRAVLHYLLRRGQPEIPFSVLGFNPPLDYCWRTVE